ncbi:AMP-binding protein [Aeromicrobium tamlense]|uniref:AMP-binding protein n=1 Tax=Aeromicrobium tamlense TaxID=375541 RepID=A0A8I0FZX9_9ACTN|nr:MULTISPECIES: AMP-binding protein [Aeromicrobium]MBD1272080.1 AMP-binding protein [Aeromicrobium tamlense]NYI38727.1 acyl-CoA synthetase (AMP-forming)/AMP-acid ligase II [Aeromicrobium tamlense]
MRALTRSLWEADTSEPVLPLTVGDLLRDGAGQAPDAIALVSVAPDRDDRVWTYAELLADAEHAAAWLLERFEPGEHVAVWAPNVPEWIVLQYGAALAGLVLVTANPALRGEELRHVLEASEAVGVFHVDDFRGTDMATIVKAVLPQVSRIREAVALGGWLEDVRAAPRRVELPEVSPDSPTQIQFTSGTTGRPKAAVLKHVAMVNNARYVRERCDLPYGATYATALPLFHTAGCGLAAMGTFGQGGTLVLAELFDPSLLLTAIQDHRVKGIGAVPAMLHAMLAHPGLAGFDLSALDVVMSGGDLVPPVLVDRWDEVCGARFSAVYGQTELSPIVCQTRPDDAREDALHTAGQPLPNVDVAILDPRSGEVVPVGTEGEICARGFQAMIEYLGQPEATAETIDARGWLHTGDLGSMDARGYVTVTGRIKDLIIRGGENIYPREIEDVLVTHPALASAVVVGLADAAWGESVAAVVQLAGAARPSAGELQTFLREHLAPHKTPKSWFVADQLPTNAMGKLQKFRLRDQIAAGELAQL